MARVDQSLICGTLKDDRWYLTRGAFGASQAAATPTIIVVEDAVGGRGGGDGDLILLDLVRAGVVPAMLT